MRPIKLTMQAFGPYAGCQVLDMADLGETGIYAITGETGAGKTTIFDAIVFALYGSGSGEDRGEGRSLRAVAASPELETRVELEFASGGKVYRIERRPEQFIAGKRRGEPVKKAAAQVLILPDGTRYTRVADIAERIERDILGVSRDQFSQIVMIAQGEFRKLLRADTRERTKILRRIFRTGRFDELSQLLKRLSGEKYAELSRSRERVAYALNAMEADPESPLATELAEMRQAKPNALFIDGAADLARRIAEADESEYADAAESAKRAEEARDQAKAAHESALRQAGQRKQLEALRAKLAGLVEQSADAEARRQAAEARAPEIEALTAAIAAETNLLPRYARVDEVASALRRVEGEIDAAARAQQVAEGEVEAIRARQSGLADEAESLKGAADRRLQASEALKDVIARGEKLNALDKRVRSRDVAEGRLRDARASSERADAAEARAIGQLESLQSALQALGNTALTLSKLDENRDSLRREAEALESIRTLLSNYARAGAECDRAQADFMEKTNIAKEMRENAMALRTRYNANIAGILAEGLEEGMPCPVCGSTHHPQLSVLTGDAVTADDVTAAEKAATAAEAGANERAGACAARREKREGLRLQLVERLPDVLEMNWAEEIRKRQSDNAAALKENAAQTDAARAADERRQQLEKSDIPGAVAARDRAVQAKSAAHAALAAAESDLVSARQEVDRAAAPVMPEDWTPLDLSDAMSDNGRRHQALDAELRKARRDVERLEAIGKEEERLRENLAKATEKIQQAREAASVLAARREGGVRELQSLRAELPYATRAACEAAITKKTAQRKAFEEAIGQARDAVNRLNQQRAGVEGEIRPLAEALSAVPPEDVPAAEAAYGESQAAYAAASKREKALGIRRANNQSQQQRLEAQSEAVRRLEGEYRVMKDVSDTANGDVTGQARVTLEAFVQTAYFDRIIDYANRRLIHMSRGQYDLVRRRTEDAGKRGQTGLDLDVVDHYNGATRAVNTLSGGESFLAALSLALGMSDAIQASAASAVQLDAMFVDEGFGSLSESFLGLVMDELNDTATSGHRLIGVISHIDEVKEGIDRRIEVTKSAMGTSTAVIV